ncbi:MAG TPA: DUF6268 family outer membrane beta-barrel protein, partial [Cytophagaceae bacterium]|nr:DUF6268 family outer membrane beta-barrel protein [Cytophagaceae bacterium]
KKTKRYIRPCLYFNHYGTPQSRFDPHKQYQFTQNNLGFYLPLYTNTWFNKDSVSLSSIQIVGTGEVMQYKPDIAFLKESYKIARLSAGVRLFYSNGNRSVFYVSVNPFVSREIPFTGNGPIRFALALIYSRTVSKAFSYRLGIIRSYTFGRPLPLPVVGIRIGALDKLHLNIQFPKNISLDLPIGRVVTASVFVRSMGGVFNVITQGDIVTTPGRRAQLRRYELLHGAQINVRAGKNISFYVSSGFATKRHITYVFKEEPVKSGNDINRHRIPASVFVSFGLSIRFGATKKIYNDRQMYDVMDLNTLKNTGLSDSGPADNDIPASPEKSKIDSAKKIKYKDVEDLIIDEY